jgi:outer membrane protein assembly factor BamA
VGTAASPQGKAVLSSQAVLPFQTAVPFTASSLLAAALVLGAASVSAAAAPGILAPFAGRRVTAIELQGFHVTRENVIRREIHTAVGEPLRADVVAADVQRLDNLSIFAEIGIGADADGEGVRLTFRLKEMPSWIPWVGFSYTEEDGFSAGPKVSALNLKGRAISLGARAYFGGAEQYSARLTWPWIGGNHVSFDFNGARLNRADTLNGFEETSYEFTPWVGTYLGEHGRLAGKFSLFRMKSDVDGKTLSPDNEDVLPRLGVSAGWDTRDSWRFPSRGWQNELELWRTSGDADFWSMNLDLRRWLPISRRQRVLVSSLTSLQSGTVGVDVPQYMMYRMGGANSIRGYAIDDLGRRLYGKSQMIETVEYSVNVVPLRRWDIWRFALRMGLDLAAFTDAGIAWNESSDLALNRARGGLGVGVRLLVPGSEMVRLDVGWSPEGGFHFHFASGSKPVSQRLRIR